MDRLYLLMKSLPQDGAAILLAHEPDFADVAAATQRFDLQISGHSHGGQIVLPIIGPPMLPEFGRKYPSGLYNINNMLLYTNRGVGVTTVNARFNCRPEITIFTLEIA
jgi:predicted MPP superfamily phosphohydrolase